MKLICPFCEKKLEIDDIFSGRQAQCPFCNNIFEVPVIQAKPVLPETFEEKIKRRAKKIDEAADKIGQLGNSLLSLVASIFLLYLTYLAYCYFFEK